MIPENLLHWALKRPIIKELASIGEFKFLFQLNSAEWTLLFLRKLFYGK